MNQLRRIFAGRDGSVLFASLGIATVLELAQRFKNLSVFYAPDSPLNPLRGNELWLLPYQLTPLAFYVHLVLGLTLVVFPFPSFFRWALPLELILSFSILDRYSPGASVGHIVLFQAKIVVLFILWSSCTKIYRVLLAHLGLIYLWAFGFKIAGTWLGGEALRNALIDPYYGTSVGFWLASMPLVVVLNYLILVVQLVGGAGLVYCALAPKCVQWVRISTVAMLATFHIGSLFVLESGVMPLLCLCVLLPTLSINLFEKPPFKSLILLFLFHIIHFVAGWPFPLGQNWKMMAKSRPGSVMEILILDDSQTNIITGRELQIGPSPINFDRLTPFNSIEWISVLRRVSEPDVRQRMATYFCRQTKNRSILIRWSGPQASEQSFDCHP